MRWTSILAIYVLFWTLSLFLVLPFGVRTAEEEGAAPGPGHAESAPHALQLPARRAARHHRLGDPVRRSITPITYGWVGRRRPRLGCN